MTLTEPDYVPLGRPFDVQNNETWCRCGAIWRGASRICHCPICHRTFTGLAGFDRHRKAGQCGPHWPEATLGPDGRYKGGAHYPGPSDRPGDPDDDEAAP